MPTWLAGPARLNLTFPMMLLILMMEPRQPLDTRAWAAAWVTRKVPWHERGTRLAGPAGVGGSPPPSPSPGRGRAHVTGSEVSTLRLTAMTLSQSSSDMWSRNSSRVMPAQDTTTDGGREKQAYGKEGGREGTDTEAHKGRAEALLRGAWFTCTCSSRRLAAAACDTSAWKAACFPRGAPPSLPGPPSRRTVSCAAAPSRSQAATAAPSCARRTLIARPMPLPAPEMGESAAAGEDGRRSEVTGRKVTETQTRGPGAPGVALADVAPAPQPAPEGTPEPVTRASAERSRS